MSRQKIAYRIVSLVLAVAACTPTGCGGGSDQPGVGDGGNAEVDATGTGLDATSATDATTYEGIDAEVIESGGARPDGEEEGGGDAAADLSQLDAGMDASLGPGADASNEPDGALPFDAGLPGDAQMPADSSRGSAEDGAADAGPDSGGDGGCGQQAACNAFLEANRSSFLNRTNDCSATELALYSKTVTGQPTGACLGCALTKGCLDDTFIAPGADARADFDHECDDFAARDAGVAAVEQCLAVVGCDLGVSGVEAPGDCPGTTAGTAPVWNQNTGQGQAQFAYCGLGVTVTACTGTGSGQGPKGVCLSEMTAGFPGSFTPTEVENNMTNPVFPAGTGNQIMACLIPNCKTSCFP